MLQAGEQSCPYGYKPLTHCIVGSFGVTAYLAFCSLELGVLCVCFVWVVLQSLVWSTSALDPVDSLSRATYGLFAHIWYDTFTTAYVVRSMIPSLLRSSEFVHQVPNRLGFGPCLPRQYQIFGKVRRFLLSFRDVCMTLSHFGLAICSNRNS